MHVGHVGFEFDRFLTGSDRLGRLALRAQHVTQVGVERGIGCVQFAGQPQALDGVDGPADLIGDQPQQVNGLCIAGMSREHVAIHRFGFAQAPGAVMFQARLQRFGNRRRHRNSALLADNPTPSRRGRATCGYLQDNSFEAGRQL